MATKRFASIPVLLLAAWVTAFSSPVNARQGGVQIAVGDQLKITVSGSEELSKKVLIDADGAFDYPYLNRVKAAGLTTRELQADLKKRLNPDYAINPTVTVELAESVSKHFSIIGEVKASGSFPFTGQLTLLEALAKAGFVTESASDDALIIRAGQSGDPNSGDGTIKLDLYPLLSGTDQKSNVLILDGDTINVLKAKPVYITGFVRSVAAYPVRRGMTVSQALALAGGVSDKGKETGIKIERFDAQGKKQTIQVKDIKTEIVKPGDTIVVPARVW